MKQKTNWFIFLEHGVRSAWHWRRALKSSVIAYSSQSATNVLKMLPEDLRRNRQP